MSYTIQKSVSSDFSNGVNEDRLHCEIEASTVITTGFEAVQVNGDDCDLVFVSEPSAGEKTEVDTIVAAHDGSPFVIEEWEDRFFGKLSQKWHVIADGSGAVTIAGKPGGVQQLVTDTTANDVTGIWLGDVAHLKPSNNVVIEARIKLLETTNLEMRFGVMNTGFTDGFSFYTHDTNNTYYAETRSSSSTSEENTGENFRNTDWHTFKIVSKACKISFYIDDALESEIESNITSNLGTPFLRIKTLTTAARTAEIDYFKIKCVSAEG